jgi:hypothetical protein
MIKQIASEIAEGRLDSMGIYAALRKLAAYFMAKKYGCVLHKELDGVDPTTCNICPSIFRV